MKAISGVKPKLVDINCYLEVNDFFVVFFTIGLVKGVVFPLTLVNP